MRNILLSFFSVLSLLICTSSSAKDAKKAATACSATVSEATARRTLPGRQEGAITTEYRFVIIWKSKAVPTSCFWRPEKNKWYPLEITRPERRALFAGSSDYMMVEKNIQPEDIRQGDKLILTSHRHGADIMPVTVKNMPVKCLYYKTSSTGWNVIPVRNLKKLPDLVLP